MKRKILIVFVFIAIVAIIAYNLDKYVFSKSVKKTSDDLPILSEDSGKFEIEKRYYNREKVSTKSVIPKGKLFVRIANIGENDGLINIGNKESTLEVGETYIFPERNSNLIANLLSNEILFDATDTVFLIYTEE
jgi:hypothetical protein